MTAPSGPLLAVIRSAFSRNFRRPRWARMSSTIASACAPHFECPSSLPSAGALPKMSPSLVRAGRTVTASSPPLDAAVRTAGSAYSSKDVRAS
eukprot:scaffold81907_cov39-Tisochrysis_lutea.AAC.2